MGGLFFGTDRPWSAGTRRRRFWGSRGGCGPGAGPGAGGRCGGRCAWGPRCGGFPGSWRRGSPRPRRSRSLQGDPINRGGTPKPGGRPQKTNGDPKTCTCPPASPVRPEDLRFPRKEPRILGDPIIFRGTPIARGTPVIWGIPQNPGGDPKTQMGTPKTCLSCTSPPASPLHPKAPRSPYETQNFGGTPLSLGVPQYLGDPNTLLRTPKPC